MATYVLWPNGMIYDHVCRKCGSPNLNLSRIRNAVEEVFGLCFTIYRCASCETRQAKLRWVKVTSSNAQMGRDYGPGKIAT
jgi:hypothetical protein